MLAKLRVLAADDVVVMGVMFVIGASDPSFKAESF